MDENKNESGAIAENASDGNPDDAGVNGAGAEDASPENGGQEAEKEEERERLGDVLLPVLIVLLALDIFFTVGLGALVTVNYILPYLNRQQQAITDGADDAELSPADLVYAAYPSNSFAILQADGQISYPRRDSTAAAGQTEQTEPEQTEPEQTEPEPEQSTEVETPDAG